MPASYSKLNNPVMENVAPQRTMKVMAPKEENNNKGRHNLSQEKKKACHQCRQKITTFGKTCKSKTNRNKRPCPIKYCARCLLNRYGEQEVAQMGDRWTCPKCRGICNCSCCRKKRGEKPTGILTHIAKASGYNCVHDLLQNGSKAMAALHVDVSLKCVPNKANIFWYKGVDLIALLPPVPIKRRTTKYKPNKKYIVEMPPLPRAANNVIPNGSQATSSAGAQAAQDTTAFRLFGFLIQVGRK